MAQLLRLETARDIDMDERLQNEKCNQILVILKTDMSYYDAGLFAQELKKDPRIAAALPKPIETNGREE